jgi:sugar/nucleoside kinase (ribokinase family)
MKNMKASVPVEWLTGESFNFYAKGCAALLARAHARAGDAAAIAGYCGKSPVLDEALVTWAEAYGDQTEQDHERLVKAIKAGKGRAIEGV